MMAIRGHESTTGKMKNAANDGASDEHPPASESVDEGQNTTRGDEEDDILDNRRGECSVSGLRHY